MPCCLIQQLGASRESGGWEGPGRGTPGGVGSPDKAFRSLCQAESTGPNVISPGDSSLRNHPRKIQQSAPARGSA